MKIQKPWTEEEKTFLKENYKRKGVNFCIEHLKRNKSSIYNKVFQLNLQTKTEKNGRRSVKPIYLKNVKGYSKSFPNRKICAEQTNIPITQFSNLLNKGKTPKKYCINGWYDPQELKEPLYILDEDDNLYKIEHFYEFCLKHSLETQQLTKLLNGQRFFYNGFRKLNTPKKIPKIKKYHVYISPEKIAYTVDNISKFSKKLNLHRQGFYSLNAGTIHSYNKGWRIKNILFKDPKQKVVYKVI